MENKSSVEWLYNQLSLNNTLLNKGTKIHQEMEQKIVDHAKEIEKEEKVKFALKVYLEKRQTHGGDIMQIAEKLVNL